MAEISCLLKHFKKKKLYSECDFVELQLVLNVNLDQVFNDFTDNLKIKLNYIEIKKT
jgi:hypothetical protein